eukprot:866451_1
MDLFGKRRKRPVISNIVIICLLYTFILICWNVYVSDNIMPLGDNYLVILNISIDSTVSDFEYVDDDNNRNISSITNNTLFQVWKDGNDSTDTNDFISICDTPRYKRLCTQLTHPICKRILWFPILLVSHHKTGHTLSYNMITKVQSFCTRQSVQSRVYARRARIHNRTRIYTRLQKARIKQIRKTFVTTLSPHPKIGFHQFHQNDQIDFKHSVVLHFMRDPVDTILSGFYYHAKANEKWLQRSMYRSQYTKFRAQNEILFQDVISSNVNKQNYYQKYFKTASKNVSLCFNVPTLISNGNNKFPRAPNLVMSVQRLYRGLSKNQVQMGLFWEFIRYYNCEWSYSYLMHQIGSQYFKHYHVFHLSDFTSHSRFDENINRLLDILNIVVSKENVDRLNRFDGNYSLDRMAQQRDTLFELLKQEDKSDVATKKEKFLSEGITVRERYRDRLQRGRHHGPKRIPVQGGRLDGRRYPGRFASSHFTKGDFDRKESIKLLLTLDERICHILKHMTVWLEFEWNHSTFC